MSKQREYQIQNRYGGGTQPSLPWSDLEARPWSTLDPNIGSSQDLQTIRTWISSCEASHEHCRPPNTFFPARIIDVEDAYLGLVRLRNRDDVKMQHGIKKEEMSRQTTSPGSTSIFRYPAYWTLSHRWGDPEYITQLLKTTEHRFREGIAFDDLSPTFRDAALLVHRLGYRYIWIDSLCIFQDSPTDWQQEANAMGDVYHHPYCNISAVGPSSNPSKEGLFRKRKSNARLLYPFKVNIKVRGRHGEGSDESWMVWNDSS